MRRGPRNLRGAADGVGLTQFGGVALLEQFFQRILSIAKTPLARNLLIIQVVSSKPQPMIETLRGLAIVIFAALRERRDLVLENLALR
jgi:hypothetical protein